MPGRNDQDRRGDHLKRRLPFRTPGDIGNWLQEIRWQVGRKFSAENGYEFGTNWNGTGGWRFISSKP